MLSRSERSGSEQIPTLRTLASSVEEIKEKAKVCADRWNQKGASVQIQVEKCTSEAGGGALPETEIPSYGVALESTEITVEGI